MGGTTTFICRHTYITIPPPTFRNGRAHGRCHCFYGLHSLSSFTSSDIDSTTSPWKGAFLRNQSGITSRKRGVNKCRNRGVNISTLGGGFGHFFLISADGFFCVSIENMDIYPLLKIKTGMVTQIFASLTFWGDTLFCSKTWRSNRRLHMHPTHPQAPPNGGVWGWVGGGGLGEGGRVWGGNSGWRDAHTPHPPPGPPNVQVTPN